MLTFIRFLRFMFFMAIMAWGAWATLYDKQMHGMKIGDLPSVPSPVLPNSLVGMLPIIGIALAVMTFVATLLKKNKVVEAPQAPRRRTTDFDDDDPGKPLVDDEKIAAAVARYRAEQEARIVASGDPYAAPAFAPQAAGAAPVTFGRRKTDLQ